MDQRIPGLFGGGLRTTICPRCATEAQQNPAGQVFSSLSAEIASVLSETPVPSASGSFRFAWDPDLDTFVRFDQSLGTVLAERAQTLGRHTGVLSVSYTHADFDTLEGMPLDHMVFTQPALSSSYKFATEFDRQHAQNDILQTTLNLGLSLDQFFFAGAFGLTDAVDVSVALSVTRIHMRAAAQALIQHTGVGGAAFAPGQPGVCGTSFPVRCARDSFDDSKFGTGDIFLRGKWHVYDTEYADLAVAGVLTVPTGNADDFLGFHDPTFTPWFVASKSFGRISPHLDVGYAFRSGKDVSQAEWIAGADLLARKWLTLNADFLGFHDDKRHGINDNVLQSAVGFKINPIGHLVIGGAFQFPLNRDGLRADVIYTGQAEYTF
ncbi:MAG: hypothetical protein ACHQ9S_24730 [Candidatus Binatia bacterium]